MKRLAGTRQVAQARRGGCLGFRFGDSSTRLDVRHVRGGRAGLRGSGPRILQLAVTVESAQSGRSRSWAQRQRTFSCVETCRLSFSAEAVGRLLQRGGESSFLVPPLCNPSHGVGFLVFANAGSNAILTSGCAVGSGVPASAYYSHVQVPVSDRRPGREVNVCAICICRIYTSVDRLFSCKNGH